MPVLKQIWDFLDCRATKPAAADFSLYCVPERQEDVRVALMEEGVTDMTFSFVTEGAQVVVNDSFIDATDTDAGIQPFI